MINPPNIGRTSSSPVTDHLVSESSKQGAADNTQALGDLKVSRMYIGKDNTLQRSSNFISHAIRAIMGKTQGVEALRQAMTAQYGTDPLTNTTNPGVFKAPDTYRDVASIHDNLAKEYDVPDLEEWDADDQVQANVWNEFQVKDRFAESQIGEILSDQAHGEIMDDWAEGFVNDFMDSFTPEILSNLLPAAAEEVYGTKGADLDLGITKKPGGGYELDPKVSAGDFLSNHKEGLTAKVAEAIIKRAENFQDKSPSAMEGMKAPGIAQPIMYQALQAYIKENSEV